MTWDEVGELLKAGWHMGAHTVNHPNLSDLSEKDSTGTTIAEEMPIGHERSRRSCSACDRTLLWQAGPR